VFAIEAADPGGGGVTTVIVALPERPSDVAVIEAVPAAIAVTRPLVASTVATPTFDDVQRMDRPVNTRSRSSYNVAVAVVALPTARGVVPSATATLDTGRPGAGSVTVNF